MEDHDPQAEHQQHSEEVRSGDRDEVDAEQESRPTGPGQQQVEGDADERRAEHVDHDQRRAEIDEAALRVILREGLAGVTIRGVAAETGWSTGALRHYFPNQHELQTYVMQALTDNLRERVVPRVQKMRTEGSAVDRIASIVEEVLPLDDERREEYALWSSLVEWERLNPDGQGSRTWRDQRALHRQSVQDPARALHPHPDEEVELWAALLHTFVDGLASQLVTTPRKATTGIRTRVRSVPTPRCHAATDGHG